MSNSDTTPIATSKTTISEEPSLLWCLNVLQFGEAEFADDPNDVIECDAIYHAACVGLAKRGYSERHASCGRLVKLADDED